MSKQLQYHGLKYEFSLCSKHVNLLMSKYMSLFCATTLTTKSTVSAKPITEDFIQLNK